jgi:hypothetical protein
LGRGGKIEREEATQRVGKKGEEPPAGEKLSKKKEGKDRSEFFRCCRGADIEEAYAVRMVNRLLLFLCPFAISFETGGGRLNGGCGGGGGGGKGQYVRIWLSMRNGPIRYSRSLVTLHFFSFGFVSELGRDT